MRSISSKNTLRARGVLVYNHADLLQWISMVVFYDTEPLDIIE
jgi:hypothetical protein